MSELIVIEQKVKRLNAKLDSAINARSELEKQLSTQTALLTNFISKLAHACKGIDSQLDTRLAKLIMSFKKSINLPELEKELLSISSLLQQHSALNDKTISKTHQQLQTAVINLKKVQPLAANDRQHIKKLAYTIKDNQESLISYIPIMSNFIAFYETLLTSKDNVSSTNELSSSNAVSDEQIVNVDEQAAPKKILERFNIILKTLSTSGSHKTDINKIKSSLNNDVSSQTLMLKCLNVFDLIIDDLTQERNTAKMFFSTLSETLTSVQESVKSTMTTHAKSHNKHDKINKKIKDQITKISDSVEDASSLVDVKEDVNNKLLQIANSFKIKAQLEQQQREALQEQLHNMTEHVDELEQQSVIFEKRIKEQQLKSLTDALTKLNNRAAFDEYFAKEVFRFHHKPFDLTVSVVDLDDFKRINDTYGHTAGDKTLQVVASTLTKVIGKDAFISRYGGEEFVLIFNNIEKNTVIKKLNTLCKTVAKLPFTFKNMPVTITLSVGVTLMKKDDNIHSVFERADNALYQAKRDGKNKVVFG